MASAHSILFDLPKDVFDTLIDHLDKPSLYKLSRTCSTFLHHPSLQAAIYHDYLGQHEVLSWICERFLCRAGKVRPWRNWPPHFSRSITPITGPLVRCLSFPESVNLNDLKQVDKYCSNVEELDFTMTREAIDATRQGTRLAMNGHFAFPVVLSNCQDLLSGVKRVSINYGNGMNLKTEGLQSFPEGLPRLLGLTKGLEALHISCRYRNKRCVIGEGLDEIPQRAETARELCRAIVKNVGLHLNQLVLVRAPFSIANLYDFALGLETLPHLKTIQVSVHRDLLCYERGHFYRLRDSPDSDPMTETWEYLNALRRVEERGRFAIRNSDAADDHQCDPMVYFPYSRVSDSVDPDFDMAQYASPSYRAIGWTPVWNWLAFFAAACPRGPPHPRSWGRYWELTGARQLFQVLHQAGAQVSVSFNAIDKGGALFAHSRAMRRERSPNDAAFLFGEDEDGGIQNVNNSHQPSENSTGDLISFGDDSDSDLGTQETPDIYSRTKQAINPHFDRELARDLAYEQVWQLKTPGQPHSFIPCTEAHLEPKLPFALGQTCDSPNCCNIMTDVRVIYDQTFDECVSIFEDFHPEKLAATDLKNDALRRACRRHLGKRLEEESKRLAILFRSFKSHFHLLKRLTLYMPAALYPDNDQTFVDHCLPGTGWNVSRPGTTNGSMPLQSFLSINPAFKAFSLEQCPFISRVFTRAKITNRAESRILFGVEESENVRPSIDLKSLGIPSMETLVTCPLQDHFVYREDFVLHRTKAGCYRDGERQIMVGGEAWEW